MKKHLKRILLAFVILYIGILGYISINQRALLYFPDKKIEEVTQYNLDNTKEVFLTTEDGNKIQTWYHAPAKGKPMVIYYHGNSYNLAWRKTKFRELIDMGYGFIAPSWRGFGKSEGEPTKEGLYSDARAAVNYLLQLGYKTEDTIVIGESLGSGMAVQMAVENHFKGVMLITPYTSIADRAQEIYWFIPVSLLIKDNFTSLDKIDSIHAPLLIVHGDKDEVIPYAHAEKLFEKAQEPKKLVTYHGKGHNNLDSLEMFKEMNTFFNVSEQEGESEHYAQN